MNKILYLEFQGLPPTTNNMYRNSGSRRYKRQEVADWQEDIANLLSEQWSSNIPYRDRATLTVNFTAQDKRNWDIDNRLKALIDCLVMAGVIKNDNQIDILHVTRKKGTENKTQIILNGVAGR